MSQASGDSSRRFAPARWALGRARLGPFQGLVAVPLSASLRVALAWVRFISPRVLCGWLRAAASSRAMVTIATCCLTPLACGTVAHEVVVLLF